MPFMLDFRPGFDAIIELCLFILCVQFQISLLPHQNWFIRTKNLSCSSNFHLTHLPGFAAVLVGEVVNTLSKLVHYQQRERGSGWVQQGVKRPKRGSSPKEVLFCFAAQMVP